MHAAYLGVLRVVAMLLMLLPLFKSKATIDLLNARFAIIEKSLLAAYRVPPVHMTKSNGSFKLPTGKAANSKNLFCFYMQSAFGGLLSEPEAKVLALTVRIALALASGAVYTAPMVQSFEALLIEHHKLIAVVFGVDSLLPNFHLRACVRAWALAY